MRTPSPLKGPHVDGDGLSTPPRHQHACDEDEQHLQYPSQSKYNMRSPLNWPPLVSPGIGRTPYVVQEGRLSLEMFEFGQDGELLSLETLMGGGLGGGEDGMEAKKEVVATAAPGTTTAPGTTRTATAPGTTRTRVLAGQHGAQKQPCTDGEGMEEVVKQMVIPKVDIDALRCKVQESLASAKQTLGFGSVETHELETRLVETAKLLSPSPLLKLPEPSLTPKTQPQAEELDVNGQKRDRDGHGQTTLTGNLTKFKKSRPEPVGCDDGHGDDTQTRNGLKITNRATARDHDLSLKKNACEDLSTAPPEKRYERIQALYGELQLIQDKNFRLQSAIKQRETHLNALNRDNNILWSMAAHIGSAIHMALDKQRKQAEATVLAPRQHKTPLRGRIMHTPEDNDENSELNRLFSPASQELLASCNLFVSPIAQPFGETPTVERQQMHHHHKTPSKIEFPDIHEDPVKDVQLSQAGSFSFHV